MEKLGRRLLLCPLVAIVLAACAPMGGRDGGPGGGPGGGMGRGQDMGGPGGGMGMQGGGGVQTVLDQLQNQLKSTADELKLTPKQLPLWDDYQEKVGALMSDMLRIPPYRGANQGAMQQINSKINTVRNRLTALEDIAEAAKKLYDSLDDVQKKVADRRLALTVPTLYSGLAASDGGPGSGTPGGMQGSGGRGGMGGPMGGGMGGPTGGGMGGRMGGGF